MSNSFYVISATPKEDLKLLNLFQSGEKSLMDLLSNPGSFRYAGWDLETYDQAKIIEGDYLEVKNGERKVIQLYEDGSLILKVPVDENFLGWGMNKDVFNETPKLNTLALIEVTTNFVYFYKKIISYFDNKPESILFVVNFSDLFIDEKKMTLVPAVVDERQFNIGTVYSAPQNNFNKEIEISVEELLNKTDLVSYKILEKIFNWFGIPSNIIPYTKDVDGEKNIDIQKWLKK